MAASNYINFADYMQLHADDIKRMEEAIRAEEQKRLQEAVDYSKQYGDQATAAAYWGETGGDFESYGDWERVQAKQEAAKRWQEKLKTDEGQREILSKLYGGGASALEAGMAFGAQETGQKSAQKVKLGEYLGLDSGEFDKELNETMRADYKAAAADFQRELAKKQASQAEWAEYAKQKGAWDVKNAEQDARFERERKRTLQSEIEKKRRMGREFYASPDWNEWINFLAGEGEWDRSKESEYKRRVFAGQDIGQAPAEPGGRYSGRLVGTREDYEREQRAREEEEQRRNYARYY